MAKKYHLKKGPKIGLILIILLTVVGFISLKLYQDYRYRQTYEYKLLQINYPLPETKILIDKLANPELDSLLEQEYRPEITLLVKEPYFLFKNLERYLNYQKEHQDLDYKAIVALVNVKRDAIYYDEPIDADTTKQELMLVNKYYFLTEDYAPENIIKVDINYAYEGHRLIEEVFNAFKDLNQAAKEAGYNIVINSGYRTYTYQKELWENRKATQGQKKADEFVARAGHSEHQTGYAIDVADFLYGEFTEEKASYEWMLQNCYKYGFILRYPKDKENITGYTYEPWHYRYVGKEVAGKIWQEKITFDEYYAFYLDK